MRGSRASRGMTGRGSRAKGVRVERDGRMGCHERLIRSWSFKDVWVRTDVGGRVSMSCCRALRPLGFLSTMQKKK